LGDKKFRKQLLEKHIRIKKILKQNLVPSLEVENKFQKLKKRPACGEAGQYCGRGVGVKKRKPGIAFSVRRKRSGWPVKSTASALPSGRL